MKVEEKKKAVELRKQGESIKVIARKVGVSASSVSVWVRDISLTEEQKELLKLRNPIFDGQCAGADANKKKAVERHLKWQEEGRNKARDNNFSLFTAGCMLYWAEGYKKNNRHTVDFSNSDVNMLVLFKKFLVECFGVIDDDIGVAINMYTDLATIEECKAYWLKSLSLPDSCLRTVMCDKRPRNTQKKRNGLLKYGTVKMMVHKTELIQQIYGATKELCDFENDNWK
jgi:transposase-like protein